MEILNKTSEPFTPNIDKKSPKTYQMKLTNNIYVPKKCKVIQIEAKPFHPERQVTEGFESHRKTSLVLECKEFKPNAKFYSATAPEAEISQEDSASEMNTTACETVDQETSNLDMTMTMSEFSIQDIQEFKPKSALTASLNASSFVPFKPTAQAKPVAAGPGAGLENLELNNEFTPSTPYVHKFRTEICKNFELYGKCKYGDECSFAHGRTRMMIKSDVSVLYKTKLCKKYSTNGYCPYGMRCQFIHEFNDPNQQTQEETAQPMSSSATAFVPAATKSAQKGIEAPVQKASGTGGFGNKQTSQALEQNIAYREILVHNTNVSVQEYQKKSKMYNQKVTKPKQQNLIKFPNIDYINIYEKTVRRMLCFPKLDAENKNEDDFYGTATLYDTFLDKQIKACVAKPEPANQSPFSLNSMSFTPALVEDLSKQLSVSASKFVPVSPQI